MLLLITSKLIPHYKYEFVTLHATCIVQRDHFKCNSRPNCTNYLTLSGKQSSHEQNNSRDGDMSTKQYRRQLSVKNYSVGERATTEWIATLWQ